jgi:hypothetical protein
VTRATAVLPALLLFLAAPLLADEEPLPKGFRVAFAGERFRVIVPEDMPLAPTLAADYARRAEAAYAFARAMLGWQDDTPLAATVTVEVLAGPVAPHVRGRREGPDRIEIAAAHLDEPGSATTLAHELTHIQDRRARGTYHVPAFLVEGRAVAVGGAYRVACGVDDRKYVQSVARRLARVTAADARHAFDWRPHAKAPEISGFAAEALGDLFLEFLRTRFLSGSPDALVKTTRIVEHVGRGGSFEKAFAREFGAPYAEAQSAFVDWVEKTEGRPEERLRGTRYADLAAPAGAAK